MKKLIKSKSGMSLLEVMIALAILGVLTVPIMTAFMNTQLYAKKVDKQNEINAITRTVKQIVTDGFIRDEVLEASDGSTIDTLEPVDGNSDHFRDIINEYSKDINKASTYTSPSFLKINKTVGPTIVESKKYKYKLEYCYNECYNPSYENVHHVVIMIYDYDSEKLLNEIKVAVKL